VQLIGEDQLREYQWSSDAEELFRGLWLAVKSGKQWKKHEDPAIKMSLRNRVLRIKCQHRLDVNQDHVMFCSTKTRITFLELAKQCKETKLDCKKDKSANRYKCYPFLIVGPTGVGKEGVATFMGKRLAPDKNIVRLNVAEFSVDTMNSELIGTKQGIYTGAIDKAGVFEQCSNEGVLVLDETFAGTEELQRVLQPQLLRILEYGAVRRMGADASQTKNLNTYVIMTTNETETLEELELAVVNRRIRKDLIGRIQNRHELLPLAKRPLEILPAFVWAMNQFSFEKSETKCARPKLSLKITREALSMLVHFAYPENFRQLNACARKIARSREYLNGKVVTKNLVFYALHNRTGWAGAECPRSSTDAVTIRLNWKDFDFGTRGDNTSQTFVKSSIVWPDRIDEAAQDSYSKFLNRIVYNVCNRNRSGRRTKIQAMAEAFAEKGDAATVDDANGIIDLIRPYLNDKKNSSSAELDRWMSFANQDLRSVFPSNDKVGIRVFQHLANLPSQQRVMITWLLTGVYYVELTLPPDKVDAGDGP
jgi:DNA replication protein DnaC